MGGRCAHHCSLGSVSDTRPYLTMCDQDVNSYDRPMPSDFKGIRKAIRTADPLIPDAQGLNAIRGKGTRIPAKAIPLDAAEIIAVPAGLNLGGQAATLLPLKIPASIEDPVPHMSDSTRLEAHFSSNSSNSTESSRRPVHSSTSCASPLRKSDDDDRSDKEKSWIAGIVRDNSDIILVTVAVVVVAGTAYYIYRWWTSDKEEEASKEERATPLDSTS